MTGNDVFMRRFLAVSVVFGFFGALSALLFLPELNPNVRETVAMLIGVLGAKFGTVYDFAFGDSDRGAGIKTPTDGLGFSVSDLDRGENK